MYATDRGRFGILGLTIVAFVAGPRFLRTHREGGGLPAKAVARVPAKARVIAGGALSRLIISIFRGQVRRGRGGRIRGVKVRRDR